MITALVVEKNSCTRCYRNTFERVYSAKSLKESEKYFSLNQIDVLIWDCACDDLIPFELIKSISSQVVVALLITSKVDSITLEKAINFGVRFCLKKANGPLMMRSYAVKIYQECEKQREQDSLRSRYTLPRSTIDLLLKGNKISKREIEVIAESLDSRGYEEIAARLYISKGTVKRHFHNIYSKLGLRNRIDLKQHIHTLNTEEISTFQSQISMA